MKCNLSTASLRFVCFAAVILIASAEEKCPNIITKDQWNSKPLQDCDNMTSIPNFAIIAHTVSQECNTIEDCSEKILNIQQYHIRVKGYYDISYNFLVGNDGNVYEGRGWNKAGSHTKNWNAKALGFAFIGDFSDKLPSNDALEALKKLLNCGVTLGQLSDDYKLLGHRQVANTISPGLKLFNELKQWPHFSEDTSDVR